ncbi:MAG TPA: ribbon-helix-helix protein, CopG family [Gemmataceae bacterium]|nr:ribbon-helix-helix protein, CopG family [Gemmataceae bacterium]
MAKTTKGKVVISAEAPAELRADLDARAAEEGRSRSEVIVRACRFYLKYAEVERADEIPQLKGKK